MNKSIFTIDNSFDGSKVACLVLIGPGGQTITDSGYIQALLGQGVVTVMKQFSINDQSWYPCEYMNRKDGNISLLCRPDK